MTTSLMPADTLQTQIAENLSRLAAGEITVEQARAENRRLREIDAQEYEQGRITVLAQASRKAG